jgi:type VI secretion system secreted protein VgrG
MSHSLSLVSLTGDYTQAGKTIAIDSPLGDDALLLTSVEGEDALSRCFLYTVEFLTRARDSDVRGLIGHPVTIWLQNHQPAERQPANGFIRRVVDLPSQYPGFAHYRAEIVPRLWFLDCTSDCRIFQNLTYPDIIRQVLQDHGLGNVQFKLLKTDYPVVEYCVQYRESALAFVSRLMEHVGIFFFHEHAENQHTLVITDANEFTGYLPERRLRLALTDRHGEVKTASTDTVFRPGAWSLSDYDFEGPTKFMKQLTQTGLSVALMPQHERFDFPGGYTDQAVGAWLTTLRMQEEEAQFNRLMGEATAAPMLPGLRFDFDRDDDAPAVTYLLTEVRHSGRDQTYFGDKAGTASWYRNTFVAIDATVPFRPQRVTPKSVMRGTQTATVVSATTDDPIQTDLYGRVKVHFHWDRHGKPSSGATSCWLRVAQNSAGAGFGGIATPHAGQEVIVDFLEGDPDRPLITGRVHNADKVPPLNLPSDKNKTITRDHGDNKFVMEGAAGNQHLSLIAPRKLNMFALKSAAQSLSAGVAGAQFTLPSLALNPSLGAYNSLQNAITTAYSSAVQTAKKNGSSDTDYTPASQADVTADSNSVTESNSNSYAGEDMNSWCSGTSNAWVGKGSNSITYEYAYSNVFGASASFVEGNSSSIVIGGSESIVFGLNFGANMLGIISVTLGGTVNLGYGSTLTLSQGSQWSVVTPDEKSEDANKAAAKPITDAVDAAASVTNQAIAAVQAAANAGASSSGDWIVTAAAGIEMTAGTSFTVTTTAAFNATAATLNIEVDDELEVFTAGMASFWGEAATAIGAADGSTEIFGSVVTVAGDIISLG